MPIVQRRRLVAAILFLSLPLAATAGRQMCGKTEVPAGARSCPDGSIPMFVADEVKPSSPPAAAQPAARPPAGHPPLDYYFGVWRTNVPGAVWTSPSGYRGYEWLHVRAGAAAGDLIIRPDGTYVWASYGGKSGRWVRGDAPEWPIVLIDTAENRRWVVGVDPRRIGGREIVVWDGNSFHYDGRR